ncbi:MAG: M28 family peptidase [Solirubrobacteraceae bacterium]
MDAAVRRALSRLAAIQRGSGSAGARAAAQLLAGEFELRGATVRLECERVHGTYWLPIGLACAVAAASALGRRGWALAGGALSAAVVVDELEIGDRPLRRLLRRRSALNVLGELTPTQSATHTLVVHAHHDGARTGMVFHPAIAKLAARIGGRLIERVGGTPAPMWGAAAGPILVALGAGLGRRRIRGLGAALCAAYAAAMWDIAHSQVVPGANDNLSGVAALLIVADAVRRRPCRHLRVLLLSTGSEESFLEGMEAFAGRHFDELPIGTTTFLCLESVGSPELMLLSGEGLLRLHRYPDEPRRTLERLADRHGLELHKPFRYRLATDGQLPLRAGYSTAVISSIDFYKAPSNYHWPSDSPENLCVDTVVDAASLTTAFVEELDCAAAPR